MVITTLLGEYTSGISVADLAIKYGVSERSIIARIAPYGIYKKKPYLNKLGELPRKKEEIVASIGAMVEVDQTLLKVSKPVLLMLEKEIKLQKTDSPIMGEVE